MLSVFTRYKAKMIKIAGGIFLSIFCVLAAFAQMPLPDTKPSEEPSIASEITSSAISTKPVPAIKPIKKTTFLTDHDKRIYRALFEAQDRGDWEIADVHAQKLTDMRLRSHYLYQRLFHPTEYRASYAELYEWLHQYPDHLGASDIYSLALRRKPAGADSPPKPRKKNVISGMMRELNPHAPLYRSKKKRSPAQAQAVRSLEAEITSNLRRDRITISNNLLNQNAATNYMDAVEIDTLKAQIASGYLYLDLPQKALTLANEALDRSGDYVPLAGWVAGLAAWQQAQYEPAYQYFQIVALSARASTWTKAAGAFWASRAALRLEQFDQVSRWLNVAADYDRTFYGLMAIKALGRTVSFSWDQPRLTAAHLSLLSQYAEGRRAMLLVDAGQHHLASQELLRIDPEGNETLKEALIAFASDQELPSFEIRFAHRFKNAAGRFYDSSLFPVGFWEPEKGYRLDKAYIHAIARSESKFDYKAENRYSGALGLMQILPSTANDALKTKRFNGLGRYALKNPAVNLEAGQAYLISLLKRPEINGNLLYLTIAYNAGPGNLRKWKRAIAHDDPLFFIEMLPYRETRAYAERVLTNYWIYQMQLGEKTETLAAMASGQHPEIGL